MIALDSMIILVVEIAATAVASANALRCASTAPEEYRRLGIQTRSVRDAVCINS